MSLNLVGVTALAGVPLFTRNICLNKPNEAPIPFATLAALNGVNLFSRLNDSNLMSTSTKDTKICWKVYRGSIVLIIISTTDSQSTFTHSSDDTLNNLLDITFGLLVLRCGLDEVITQNTERLKRSMKHAFPSFDYLLKLMFSGKSLSLLTNKVNYQLTDYHHTVFVESLLESYCQVASSSFACLVVNKRVIAASKHWWTRLSQSRDALLITLLVNSISTNDLQRPIEIPVYLPENCPNSVTRLVVTLLFKNVVLIVLCGEYPSLETLESQAIMPLKESKTYLDHFRKLFQTENKLRLPLDENVVGFVFIRQDLQLITKYGKLDDSKLKDIAKFVEVFNTSRPDGNQNFESFVVFKNYKCFGVSRENQIFVLFSLQESTNEMRKISLKTLSKLNKEKKLWP